MSEQKESKTTQTPRSTSKLEPLTPSERMNEVRRRLGQVVYGIFAMRTKLDVVCRDVDIQRNVSKQEHAMLMLRTNKEFIKVVNSLRRHLNEIEDRGVGLHHHTVALIDDFEAHLFDEEPEEEKDVTKKKDELGEASEKGAQACKTVRE